MSYQIVQDDLHIHGGVVEQVVCNGDVVMHGGAVNTMTVQGDCIQHGGIINRQVQQKEPRVVYRDRVVYKDKIIYVDGSDVRALKRDNARLRKELDEKGLSDDVLVMRIESLESQLKREREAHRNEVEELKWRLDAITDIAIGRNKRIYDDETNGHYIGVTDDSLDVLFTLINCYAISNNGDLSEEFGITKDNLKYIAKVLRLAKSQEERREARERLKRHGMDLIERRGGDHTNGKKKTKRKTDGHKK